MTFTSIYLLLLLAKQIFDDSLFIFIYIKHDVIRNHNLILCVTCTALWDLDAELYEGSEFNVTKKAIDKIADHCSLMSSNIKIYLV